MVSKGLPWCQMTNSAPCGSLQKLITSPSNRERPCFSRFYSSFGYLRKIFPPRGLKYSLLLALWLQNWLPSRVADINKISAVTNENVSNTLMVTLWMWAVYVFNWICFRSRIHLLIRPALLGGVYYQSGVHRPGSMKYWTIRFGEKNRPRVTLVWVRECQILA